MRSPLQETLQTACVIVVLVGDEDALEVLWSGTEAGQSLLDTPHATVYAGIYERPAVVVLQEEHAYEVREAQSVHPVDARRQVLGYGHAIVFSGQDRRPCRRGTTTPSSPPSGRCGRVWTLGRLRDPRGRARGRCRSPSGRRRALRRCRSGGR